VVRRIFDEYLQGPRGLTEIRDLLNSDPERFPPPNTADPARSLGAWSRSSVQILRNPKYTGYQVWNRRARKDKRRRNRPTRGVGVVRAALSPAHHQPPRVRPGTGQGGQQRPLPSWRHRFGASPEQGRAPVSGAAAVQRLRLRMKGHRGTLPLLPLPHHHAARRQDPTRPPCHHQLE
jgi:hypothetical protein